VTTMKILIIDDDAMIRRIARAALGRAGGMDVHDAGSGEEGLRLAVAEPPDCILLDVMMPGMGGEATLAALRERPETSGIPVIFLTANADPEDTARLEALGARGVLGKPFDPMALAGQVRMLIEGDSSDTVG
jgi:two-component system OmpR family response regulator